MMDGLSVAANVAGIISLGIQVTKSLAQFYDAYKGREQNIADIAAKLKSLLDVFESLRRDLANRKFRSDEQALLHSIEASIEDCEEHIEELKTKTEKFKHNSDKGIQAAFRNTARQLAYPIKHSTLEKVDLDIREIVSSLKFALAVLHQKDTNHVRDDIDDVKVVVDLVRATQVSSTIRDWLKAPDCSVEFNEACSRRHPGTGLWFVKESEFSAWLVKPKSFLWLTGFAGCGKSILCSTAIQYSLQTRRSNPRVGLAFFFFTFNDDSKQGVSAMLRALVLQLSSQLNNKNDTLFRLYERYRTATPPTWELEECLHQLVEAFDHVYIILDALDESPRDKCRKDVLEALVHIRKWAEPSLHLLVTSRDEADIRNVLCDGCHASTDGIVNMKNEFIDKDIASFISSYLRDSREMRRLEDYHDQIEKGLTDRANGV